MPAPPQVLDLARAWPSLPAHEAVPSLLLRSSRVQGFDSGGAVTLLIAVAPGVINIAATPPPPDFQTYGEPCGRDDVALGCIWPTGQRLRTNRLVHV